jgi:hypothetical protein
VPLARLATHAVATTPGAAPPAAPRTAVAPTRARAAPPPAARATGPPAVATIPRSFYETDAEGLLRLKARKAA